MLSSCSWLVAVIVTVTDTKRPLRLSAAWTAASSTSPVCFSTSALAVARNLRRVPSHHLDGKTAGKLEGRFVRHGLLEPEAYPVARALPQRTFGIVVQRTQWCRQYILVTELDAQFGDGLAHRQGCFDDGGDIERRFELIVRAATNREVQIFQQSKTRCFIGRLPDAGGSLLPRPP